MQHAVSQSRNPVVVFAISLLHDEHLYDERLVHPIDRHENKMPLAEVV